MVVANSANSANSASGSARPRNSRSCAKSLTQPFQASKVLEVPVLLELIAINSVASCPTAHYLVETDPRFANYCQWLGRDFMLTALGYDPVAVQKCLGDGFYEQRLIREQVSQLTGQRFLGNYTSDEQQYKGLMDAGIMFAKSYRLRPGIALSSEQMALLTSDIVWLVERDVTLPNGALSKALVPQLYVRVRQIIYTTDSGKSNEWQEVAKSIETTIAPLVKVNSVSIEVDSSVYGLCISQKHPTKSDTYCNFKVPYPVDFKKFNETVLESRARSRRNRCTC